MVQDQVEAGVPGISATVPGVKTIEAKLEIRLVFDTGRGDEYRQRIDAMISEANPDIVQIAALISQLQADFGA